MPPFAVDETDSGMAATPNGNPITRPQTPPQSPTQALAELTLGQLVGRLSFQPVQTIRLLRETINVLPEERQDYLPADLDSGKTSPIPAVRPSGGRIGTVVGNALADFSWRNLQLTGAVFALLLAAFLGSIALNDPSSRLRLEVPTLALLMVAAAFGFAILMAFNMPAYRLPRLVATQHKPPLAQYNSVTLTLLTSYGLRLLLVPIGLVLGYGAWEFTRQNTLTSEGVNYWLACIAVWVVILVRWQGWDPRTLFRWDNINWRARLDAIRLGLRPTYALLAILIVLIFAWQYRFYELANVPPDMTSDHVEKVLDAAKIDAGLRPIFFPNNGGREAFQMYYLAILSDVTGVPIGYTLAKLGSALEGLLMIVVALWAGRALFGDENREMGKWVGIIAAFLIATSYWHTTLSRLGLRIVLTTVATTVILIFLARAMRHNRRADFLWAGAALGIGLYFYQAMRATPLVVIAGVGLAILLRARSWRVLGQYVFIPSARYWNDYPDSYWERTTKRLLGDEVIILRDSRGEETGRRVASFEDRLASFRENLPEIGDNFVRAMLMFNLNGDRAWITGNPDGSPALDLMSGAMLIVGVGIFLARFARNRDPVDLLIPLGVVLTIFPTALALAYSREVPSASRSSGSLPFVYLMVAMAIYVVVHLAIKNINVRWLQRTVIGFFVLLLALGAAANWYTYFDSAMSNYRQSTFPYRQAGELLRSFSESTGAYGNTFMISWFNWWDYRALGLEAGLPDYPNGIIRDDMMNLIIGYLAANLNKEDKRYALEPNRQMLFFLHPDDVESLDLLKVNFPNGYAERVASFSPGRDFTIYIAPPVGCAWAENKLGILPTPCLSARP
jgi:hypothetical protein